LKAKDGEFHCDKGSEAKSAIMPKESIKSNKLVCHENTMWQHMPNPKLSPSGAEYKGLGILS
jgi:hypothetical protein